MYYTSGHNYNHNHSGIPPAHNHTLQVSQMPAHTHEIMGTSANLAFEKDDFIININKGIMVNTESIYNEINCNDMFLNNMCDCIISRFAGHDINLFKAGNSHELKKMIVNFLEKGDEII